MLILGMSKINFMQVRYHQELHTYIKEKFEMRSKTQNQSTEDSLKKKKSHSLNRFFYRFQERFTKPK